MAVETVTRVVRRKPSVRTAALLLLAAVVVGGGLAWRARSGAPAAPAKKPAPASPAPAATGVTIERVTAARLEQPVRVTGTLKSDEVVAVSTKATGLVRQVTVKEGDRVRAGQLLVEIDDRELRAQRDRAVAAQRSAEARLEQARTSSDIKNAAAKADYQRAQQQLATAKTRLSQAKQLAQIMDVEVDTRVATAEAGVKAAKERLKVLQEGARRQEERAAELQVARAQAQVRRAQDMYRRRAQLAQRGLASREEAENARHDMEVAVAELNVAKEQLDLVKEGPRSEEIRIAEEGVRQAESTLQEAQANRARRSVSNQDVDAAQQQVEQATAALDAAKAALAQSQWNEDEIRSAQAAVNQASADIRYYDEQIAQTRVTSPVDGIVSKRDVNVGQSLTLMMSAGLMTIVSANTLYFEATAPESALPYLAPGDAAEVTLDSMPGRSFHGVLREIIPVAQGEARAVRLRISLPRPEMEGAVVGGFARAALKGGSKGAVLSVPREAVVSDEGQTAVFLYQDGKAHWQEVRLGPGSGPRGEVLQGLRAGDQVIVSGAKSLTDGQPVRLKGQPEE